MEVDNEQGLKALEEGLKTFKAVAWDPRINTRRRALARVRQRLADERLIGEQVLQQLAALQGSASLGEPFYRFAFFVLREHETRLKREVAIRAWRVLLKGRMRRLSQWITFLRQYDVHYITDDVWMQIFRFANVAESDLSSFNTDAEWPSLIDAFVESLRLNPSPSSGDPLEPPVLNCPATSLPSAQPQPGITLNSIAASSFCEATALGEHENGNNSQSECFQTPNDSGQKRRPTDCDSPVELLADHFSRGIELLPTARKQHRVQNLHAQTS